MSGAATIERAAAGRLPDWAEMAPARRRHAARVAALMDGWAVRLGLGASDRGRWCAAAWLHDALRDADPAALRARVPPESRGLADPLLHGPAVAGRLAEAGIDDAALLDAIAYHTLGHPRLGRIGRALYLADFLEPGRGFAPAWRASLRARMPESFEAVLLTVAEARLRHLLRRHVPLHPDTVAFWNDLLARA